MAGFFEKLPAIAIKGRYQPVFTAATCERNASAPVQKGPEMRNKTAIDIRAALRLIAAENLSALRRAPARAFALARELLRNIAHLVSKPTYPNRKT